MPSIIVFGAGPALGAAVAHRYAQEGYRVVAVARNPQKLSGLVDELRADGGTADAFPADLSAIDHLPHLMDRIVATAGEPDVIYYGAAPNAFVPALELTVGRVDELMPLGVHAPITIIRALLPGMLERNSGAVITAQGASAIRGASSLAGGLVLAAQRNYWESVRSAVAETDVFIGSLYIGAVIQRSAFHAGRLAAREAGRDIPEMPEVDPAQLAELIWQMPRDGGPAERMFPAA